MTESALDAGFSAAHRCCVSIDDAGDYLLVAGRSFTFGHRGTGDPDIGFLGDVDPIHARIVLEQSFHGGHFWVLHVGGEAPRRLYHEDRVVLGASAEFRFEQRDAASASALLELGRGTDADGAPRVMLLAPGSGGRISIGARLRLHVPVAGLKSDIHIEYGPDGDPGLIFFCDGGARRAGAAADGETTLQLPLPLTGRTDLSFGAAPDRLPPFGIALRAIDRGSPARD